jgi:uncharacterized integral membrane protein
MVLSSIYPKDIPDASFSSLSEKTAGKRGLLMSGVLLCLFSIEEKAVLIVVLIIFALVGGALAVLAYENFATLTIAVHFTLFGWRAPVLPLGVVLLLACLLGALLLYIVTVLSAWRDRRQLAKLRRRVAELEQAQMNMGIQQYSQSVMIPMPGIQAPNSPPPWLN